jgi:hypothetical protein
MATLRSRIDCLQIFERKKFAETGKNAVLPRGRNFGRKAQKWPKKIWWGRESQGPNFYPIYQKRAEKGPNFF